MQNQILTNRSIVKSERISKILSNYKSEIDKHSQQSFRMLSQKIKRKIGNQINENQVKFPINKIKTDVSKFFNDHSRSQFQINVKDLLMHKSQIQKQYSKIPKDNKKMVPRINKTQNEIFKNYLAQRICNGSKTNRDSRDLDVRMKLNDKSTHSQQALLQTLINKSYENKFNEARESPELCYASQNLFNILQQSINGQSSLLLRSGSQGNVANTSQSKKNKISDPKFNKIKIFLEQTKSFHTNTNPYKLTTERGYIYTNKEFVKVDKNKIQSISKIANQIKNTLDKFNQLLLKQEKTSSMISNLISNEFSSRDSVESIQTLE